MPAALTDAERQRRRRERARRHEIVCPTPVDGCILDTLVELHWLADSDAEDRTAVGRAIHAMLSDLSRHR